jgi:hypothetical protein
MKEERNDGPRDSQPVADASWAEAPQPYVLPVAASRGADQKRDLRIVTLGEFLQMPIAPREAILGPWLLTQSLSMIHAWRGVGKTFVALNIAYAVASGGSFLKWSAKRARSVLYLDGEMQASELQARLRAIVGNDSCDGNLHNLRILTPDLEQGPMPDLATADGQAAIERGIEDAELIVVDNLSTLVRDVSRENDAESWRSVQEWALRMRQKKRAVLFVHHSGKGGAQRGSSKKEDTLDTVICLQHPTDYRHDQGARFEVHFEKARSVFGPEAASFLAALRVEDDRAVWRCSPIQPSRLEQVAALANQGQRQKDIASALGIDKSQISRLMRDARGLGLLVSEEGGSSELTGCES